MKKILILQNTVLHYRQPVYNMLSKYYDITVFHSGEKSVGDNDLYKEIVEPIKTIGPFVFQSGVLAEVKRGSYDVVVAMADLHWVYNFIIPFFTNKIRFLFWGHRYSKYWFINNLKDYFIRMSDGVILYSDTEINTMISRGIPTFKIFVAPNTIHVPNHSDGSNSQKDSFIFSGRAQKRKKIDVLIRAFAEVLNQIPENIKLNIIGSGQENDALKALAEHLGIFNRVIFHGEITDVEILQSFFHKAYAYVSPGPVGLGVLHSFAYGIPVVTSKSESHGPEFENLINNENALLYSTYDELKEILGALCSDQELCNRLGRNAYKKYSEERTLDKMVNGFIKAIEGSK